MEPKRTRKIAYANRKRRFVLAKAAPASAAIDGTVAEKKRVQGIADSLDLRGDLMTEKSEDTTTIEAETRQETAVGIEGQAWAVSSYERLPN